MVFCIRCCCFWNFLKRYSSLQVSGGCVSSNPSTPVKKWVNYRLLVFSTAQGVPSQNFIFQMRWFYLPSPHMPNWYPKKVFFCIFRYFFIEIMTSVFFLPLFCNRSSKRACRIKEMCAGQFTRHLVGILRFNPFTGRAHYSFTMSISNYYVCTYDPFYFLGVVWSTRLKQKQSLSLYLFSM